MSEQSAEEKVAERLGWNPLQSTISITNSPEALYEAVTDAFNLAVSLQRELDGAREGNGLLREVLEFMLGHCDPNDAKHIIPKEVATAARTVLTPTKEK